MCYTKKLNGLNFNGRGRLDGTEKKLGPAFDGNFGCVKYNCDGCDHGLVDGEPQKRNLRLRTYLDLSRTLL